MLCFRILKSRFCNVLSSTVFVMSKATVGPGGGRNTLDRVLINHKHIHVLGLSFLNSCIHNNPDQAIHF